MTTLAEFQVYDTDHQPWAWFTMPMLLWWLGALSLLAVGLTVAMLRRNEHTDTQLDDLRKQLAGRPTAEQHAALRDYAGTTRAQLNALLAWAHAANDHLAPDDDTPTAPAARVLIDAAFDEPAPRRGRHAAPDIASTTGAP